MIAMVMSPKPLRPSKFNAMRVPSKKTREASNPGKVEPTRVMLTISGAMGSVSSKRNAALTPYKGTQTQSSFITLATRA